MDINVVFALLMLFGFMGMMRSRGMGRRQRLLQDEIDRLQSSRLAPPPVQPGASKEQVQRLEDRVRVLERIVTDRGFNLAAEIEALRDQRPLPELAEAREVERND